MKCVKLKCKLIENNLSKAKPRQKGTSKGVLGFKCFRIGFLRVRVFRVKVFEDKDNQGFGCFRVTVFMS